MAGTHHLRQYSLAAVFEGLLTVSLLPVGQPGRSQTGGEVRAARQCFPPAGRHPFVSALERIFRVKTDRRDRGGGNHPANQLHQSDVVAVRSFLPEDKDNSRPVNYWLSLLHELLVFPEMSDAMLFSVAQHTIPVILTADKDPEVPGLHKYEAVSGSENVSV